MNQFTYRIALNVSNRKLFPSTTIFLILQWSPSGVSVNLGLRKVKTSTPARHFLNQNPLLLDDICPWNVTILFQILSPHTVSYWTISPRVMKQKSSGVFQANENNVLYVYKVRYIKFALNVFHVSWLSSIMDNTPLPTKTNWGLRLCFFSTPYGCHTSKLTSTVDASGRVYTNSCLLQHLSVWFVYSNNFPK